MRLSVERHPGHWLLGLTWGRESFPHWPGTRNVRLWFGPLALRLYWPLPPAPLPDDLAGWLCGCGNYQGDPFCCNACGTEPPWGCDCGLHEFDGEEEAEEDGYPDCDP